MVFAFMNYFQYLCLIIMMRVVLK